MTTHFLSYNFKPFYVTSGKVPQVTPARINDSGVVGKFHIHGTNENFQSGSFDFKLVNPELFDLVVRRFQNPFTAIFSRVARR